MIGQNVDRVIVLHDDLIGGQWTLSCQTKISVEITCDAYDILGVLYISKSLKVPLLGTPSGSSVCHMRPSMNVWTILTWTSQITRTESAAKHREGALSDFSPASMLQQQLTVLVPGTTVQCSYQVLVVRLKKDVSGVTLVESGYSGASCYLVCTAIDVLLLSYIHCV